MLQNTKCKQLPFHNFAHTQEVIDNVFLIADTIKLSTKEADFIAIAACFHDTAYSEIYNGHEEVSKRIATAYLEKADYSKVEIERVCDCIEATKMQIYSIWGRQIFCIKIYSSEKNGSFFVGRS